VERPNGKTENKIPVRITVGKFPSKPPKCLIFQMNFYVVILRPNYIMKAPF
jgi:hypothetical protein